jgi:hypothetical protein
MAIKYMLDIDRRKQFPLTVEGHLVKRMLVIALIITALSFAASGQSNGNARQFIAPLADHHTHIWSLAASTLVTEPLMPVVELPE